jgi:hypothetical protein
VYKPTQPPVRPVPIEINEIWELASLNNTRHEFELPYYIVLKDTASIVPKVIDACLEHRSNLLIESPGEGKFEVIAKDGSDLVLQSIADALKLREASFKPRTSILKYISDSDGTELFHLHKIYSFNRFIYESAQSILCNAIEELDEIRILEEEVIRLSIILEKEEHKRISDPLEEHFFLDVLTKIINDFYGYIGCLKVGAEGSSYHQMRGALESFIVFMYGIGNESKSKVDTRLKQYREHQDVLRYIHYIDSQKNNDFCTVSAQQFEELKLKVSDWEKLWKIKAPKQKITDIRHWHYSSSIQTLFESVAKNNKYDHSLSYSHLCHGVHVSSVTQKITNGRKMVGFSKRSNGSFDMKNVRRNAMFMIMIFGQLTTELHKRYEVTLSEGLIHSILNSGV